MKTRNAAMRQRALAAGIALVLIGGCHSSANAGGAASGTAGSPAGSPAPGGSAGAATYVKAAPLTGQLTTATITDPTFNNMVAATLTIPAGWKLQGITMTSPCTFSPWPVFRAFSPDGLMQMRTEPVVGWQWNPSGRPNNTGCAQISGPISAANFLQFYLSSVQSGVHVVGSMPVAAPYQQWASGLAANANQNQARMAPALRTQNTADTAALRVQTVNGTIVQEERLRVAVECSVNNNAGSPLRGGTCWARVDVLTAPQGQLDALVQLVDGNNLPHGVNSPQWVQAMLQRQQQQGAQALSALTAKEKQWNQTLNQQFQQIMQRSQQEHQAFMQQQESQFQSAMRNADASMNAQSTTASDWVDYALDQQTVLSPDGTLAKVSSSYSQTWTNGNQWYQTNDPNANPNGVLQGNWTRTTQMHGNGAPK